MDIQGIGYAKQKKPTSLDADYNMNDQSQRGRLYVNKAHGYLILFYIFWLINKLLLDTYLGYSASFSG